MRSELVLDVFPKDIVDVINANNAEEVAEKQIVPTLLATVSNEKIIPLFIDIVGNRISDRNNKWARRIVNSIPDAWKGESNAFKQVKEIQALFESLQSRQKELIAKEAEDALSAYPDGFRFDLFPDHACLLNELGEKGRSLSANNNERSLALITEFRNRVLADPSMRLSTKETDEYTGKKPSENKPFDFNRTGKELGIYVGASNIVTPDGGPRFILSGVPHDTTCAQNYFSAALAQDVSLFVSLHESYETPERCNKFWQEPSLSKMKLLDGSTLEVVESKVLARGLPGVYQNTVIWETTLKTSGGKIVKHLHYDGWCDSCPIPDLDLFQKLLERMHELQGSSVNPIAINCKGGVGRSFTTMGSYYFEWLIRKELEAGKKPTEVPINLPEFAYAMRKLRLGAFDNGKQFPQIFLVLEKFLTKKQSQT